jgi:hypothetical protein
MSTGRFSASDRELTVPSLTRSFVDHGWNDPLLEPWTNLRGLIYPYESPWRVSSWRVTGRPALVRFLRSAISAKCTLLPPVVGNLDPWGAPRIAPADPQWRHCREKAKRWPTCRAAKVWPRCSYMIRAQGGVPYGSGTGRRKDPPPRIEATVQSVLPHAAPRSETDRCRSG